MVRVSVRVVVVTKSTFEEHEKNSLGGNILGLLVIFY